MRKINFFADKHNPIVICDKEFLIADDKTKAPAYVTTDCTDRYAVATIVNDNETDIKFIAIDNNIEVLRTDGTMQSRCDCLLSYCENICFVELKDKKDRWIEEALNQLSSTIKVFAQNHCIDDYHKKRAYACNRQHPYFESIEFERKMEFKKNNYGFIPFINATIETK